MNAETAKIILNGQIRELKLPSTIGDLLKGFGLRPTQVVVEYNGEVLPRAMVELAPLRDRDRVEIILPVAGG